MVKEKEKSDTTDKSKGKDLVGFNARLPRNLIKKVKLFCVHYEMTLQDFAREAFEAKLKSYKQGR